MLSDSKVTPGNMLVEILSNYNVLCFTLRTNFCLPKSYKYITKNSCLIFTKMILTS